MGGKIHASGGGKSDLERWQIEDAERLRAFWQDWKKGPGRRISQAEFAARHDALRSQGMLWQYLNAYRPLNHRALAAFASGLEVAAREISPRLAMELERIALAARQDAQAGERVAAAEAAAGYGALARARQDRLLAAFVRLSREQQSRILNEAEKMAAANAALLREFGADGLKKRHSS